ncbi:MAG: serine/threonine-protein phosphatase [Gammaproteobacteria bacterium]|nr:serine/threonine-protein phosphatase [Gammaproteobacteria bacterium]
MFPDLPFRSERTVIEPGGALLMFTDGVTEARDTDGIEFGEARLRQLLAQRDATAQAMLDRIYRTVGGHVEHAEPTHDLILLGIVRSAWSLAAGGRRPPPYRPKTSFCFSASRSSRPHISSHSRSTSRSARR